MYGKYVYGIIDSNNQTDFNISGLNGSSPVYSIVHEDLSCVMSNYSGEEFSSMAKEEVVRCLLVHQVVVEHIMREQTVLPVKFGTVLTSLDEVRSLLSQGHSQFVDILAWIQDKVEIEVAATWDKQQIFQEISTEPEIIRASKTIVGKGQQTFEEQIQLGQIVKASMDKRRSSYRERMINFLTSVAVDVQPNALVSDEMVMNVAFLVEKTNQEEFDSCVKQLNDLFDNQINFRIIGPLPPYSFATVEVTRPSPEKIEEARQFLHLGKTFSEPEVRKAYRHLAAESHPDYKGGDELELAKAQFVKLHHASELLIAYCRGQGESDGNLLISIRRLKDEEVEHLSFAGTGV
jgi:hypothetical protein